MSGVIREISRPFEDVAHIVVPVAAGMLGGPGAAAAAGALMGATKGGNSGNMFKNMAIGGVGGYAGGALGQAAGIGYGHYAASGLTGLGAGAGSALTSAYSAQQARKEQLSKMPPLAAPTFAQLKEAAVLKTQAEFAAANINQIMAAQARGGRTHKRTINVYNRNAFVPFSNLIRSKSAGK